MYGIYRLGQTKLIFNARVEIYSVITCIDCHLSIVLNKINGASVKDTTTIAKGVSGTNSCY